MDEATATPITPPRFCEVLSRPEATPASRSVTPVSAPMEIGMNAKAVPMPATKNGPARSGQKLPWGGAWAAHSIPAPMRAIPKAMTALAEVRVTIFWERPANAREVTDAVIQAPPGRQSGKPEHLLHVEGAHEDEGEKARAQQEAGSVRSGHAAQLEQRQRQERCLGFRFDDEEHHEQRSPGGEHSDGLSGRPASLWRPGDGVHDDQQRGGDRDGAEGVVAPARAAYTALGHQLGGQVRQGNCKYWLHVCQLTCYRWLQFESGSD
jgi:hypothetical protein